MERYSDSKVSHRYRSHREGVRLTDEEFWKQSQPRAPQEKEYPLKFNCIE